MFPFKKTEASSLSHGNCLGALLSPTRGAQRVQELGQRFRHEIFRRTQKRAISCNAQGISNSQPGTPWDLQLRPTTSERFQCDH